MSKAAKILNDEAITELASELRSLIGSLRRQMRKDAGVGDFTSSQMAVLARLFREGPATLTSLADSEGVRSQSMSAIISVLEEANFVTRSPHPTDGRQTILSLTELAKEWVRHIRVVKDDWLFQAITTKLSIEEQQDLSRLTELLKKLNTPSH